MGDVTYESISDKDKTEDEIIHLSFLDGMSKMRTSNSKKYNDICNIRSGDRWDKWYKNNVTDMVESLKNIRLSYRCKRVTYGVFTNKPDEYPVLQVDFNTGKVYIVNRVKSRFKYYCNIDKLDISVLRSESDVITNSFSGKFIDGTFDSRVRKVTYKVYKVL